MFDNLDSNRLTRNLVRFFRWGMIVVVLAILGYFIPRWGLPYTSDSQVWGELGDFFGGILNPVFGFLAFLGLLYAVALQSAQLRDTHAQIELLVEQFKLADLEKAVRLHSEMIDASLTRKIVITQNHTPELRLVVLQAARIKRGDAKPSARWGHDTLAAYPSPAQELGEAIASRLGRVAVILSTYDEIFRPHSPQEPPTWYTDAWRSKFVDVSDDLWAIGELELSVRREFDSRT